VRRDAETLSKRLKALKPRPRGKHPIVAKDQVRVLERARKDKVAYPRRSKLNNISNLGAQDKPMSFDQCCLGNLSF
jgi:hypothetical protein